MLFRSYPAKVIAAPEAVLVQNGCSLAGLKVPTNVEVITDNPDPKFFNLLLSRSRMVVLPVKKESTTQAGISVYLQAMALEKCVVISDGLGVNHILDDGQAVVVPAGDAQALGQAISRVWEDAAYRNSIAKKGRAFAETLGGEDQLRRNILRALGVTA